MILEKCNQELSKKFISTVNQAISNKKVTKNKVIPFELALEKYINSHPDLFFLQANGLNKSYFTKEGKSIVLLNSEERLL